MSGPFVYKPPTTPVTYRMPHFQTPYTHTPRSATPFIPDSPMYPSSPYSWPPSLNASPTHVAVPLPRFDFPDQYPYASGYNIIRKPRREQLPVWQDGDLNPWLGVPPPFSAPLDGNPAGVSPYSQRRRHSFSSASSPSIQIHPLLNAEAPINDFFFDLSSPMPNPLHYYRGAQATPVSSDYLAQSVAYPHITRMRIISDTLPQDWDINLNLPPELYERYVRAGYYPPPITLQDVLNELHHRMQLQITYDDWERLSRENMENVRRAFSRRCRAAPGGREGYEAERAKGVKRVDYLWGKTRFVGLLKMGKQDGLDTFRLITTDPYKPT